MTPADALVDRLHRTLVAARSAAAHKDLHNLVVHGGRTLEVVDQLRRHDPQDGNARLDLVAAAVDLGVDAGRKRNWSFAYDALDLIHSLTVEHHDPRFWEAGFWVPFAERWPGRLGAGLGVAAERMGISTFPTTR